MSKQLCEDIVKVLDDKKALKIKAIEIKELTIVADYFVIATATSTTHLRALIDEVEKEMTLKGSAPARIEGRATGWVLADFSDVVVHLFLEETREFYNLERLWDDAANLDISHIIKD
ncbi:MAG TPA: ribosome silencing factor [Oscillospiraceae bacterium]|nr:ribosome silencing factor [Oscillospiraceae bacterium]